MNVCSVVVCYHPNVESLRELCNALLTDRSRVVLIDNTEKPYLKARNVPEGCKIITLGFNSGIAHAQNVGIDSALASGADAVAFFDQDSRISTDLLTLLVSALDPSATEIVSPRCFDVDTDAELPSLRLDRCGFARRVHWDASAPEYHVDVVISSGTVATKSVFEVAGKLDESLFIDFVDTEWCLRCRSKEVPIRVIPAALMRHRIGSQSIDLGLIALLVHSPVRCYYQIRNCFHLLRKQHVPRLFALREVLSTCTSRLLLLLFVSDRRRYGRAYWYALRDGILGVTGTAPQSIASLPQ